MQLYIYNISTPCNILNRKNTSLKFQKDPTLCISIVPALCLLPHVFYMFRCYGELQIIIVPSCGEAGVFFCFALCCFVFFHRTTNRVSLYSYSLLLNSFLLHRDGVFWLHEGQVWSSRDTGIASAALLQWLCRATGTT